MEYHHHEQGMPMPVLPASLFEPLWGQFAALLPERPRVVPTHPLGCHRERVSDRLVFEHVIAALVHGSGYERIATPGCSDRTIRRRLQEWAALGLAEQVHHLVLEAYERMIGLDLEELAVDGCITKAPAGGEVAGRSPVDRGKQGLKRSVLTEGAGIPLSVVPAGANRHDAPLLPATLAGLETIAALTNAEPGTIHLDQAYAGAPTRALLEGLGLDGAIARKGVPAPRQAGNRWRVERTHSWMNGYGKLRRCTEKRRVIVQFYLFLAAALVVLRQLIQQARRRYRWPGRPATRRLK
jgi:transposase